MIFHVSVFTSIGAVRTTLSDADIYKRKRDWRFANNKALSNPTGSLLRT
jgi:hypothetical protein